jgi:uncharacterized membrane protein YjjP (DUF1212 family)
VRTTEKLTRSLGLPGCVVEVTLTVLTLSHRSGPRAMPVTEIQIMRGTAVSYERIRAVHRFAAEIRDRPPGLASAMARLDGIEAAGQTYPPWPVALSWGALSGFFTIMLGGGPVVYVAAFLVALALDYLNRWMTRHAIPVFHRAVLGVALATGAATALFLAGSPARAR